MPGQFLNNSTQPNFFNDAKGYDFNFQDPNGELMAAVKEREGKIVSREE